MEKEFGSWFRHQQFDQVSPDLDTLTAPFNLGQQNSIPAYMSHYANVSTTNGISPWSPFMGFPHLKATQPIEPRCWFDFSPRFQQAFTQPPNTTFKEKIPTGRDENVLEVIQPDDVASRHDQRRFLVFDQSGKQTKIFSSEIASPGQCLTSLGPKLNNAYDLNKLELETGKDNFPCAGHILSDECYENHRDDSESEMHEDTEELNALLYSDDDDDYTEDDEEASTGHSPSQVKVCYNRDSSAESEEVASCGGPTKRMKLSDEGYDFPWVVDTACSVKPKRKFDCEDDAESSCAGGKNMCVGEKSVSVVGNKRLRKDNLREAVRAMQNIIPGGKGNDVAAILDEAISYLRSLKYKAMALGVDETL